MQHVPGCQRERNYSVTHLLPTPEAWLESQARAIEVARRAVALGYRVSGHGKHWRVVRDPEKARLIGR